MGSQIKIGDEVLQRFPVLKVLVREVKGVRVSEADPRLEEFKKEVFADVKCRFTLEGLKDEPVFRAYRAFFWSIGIDPTKIRPAAEALIRRVLGGKPIPRINTAVDAYNLASMTTCIALAAFDINRLDGDITMRFANKGEEFLGIGMDKPLIMAGGEIVMTDASRLIAIYPYRDAEYSKITLQTNELMLVSCGVPSIPLERLKETVDKASEFITRFCGGRESEEEKRYIHNRCINFWTILAVFLGLFPPRISTSRRMHNRGPSQNTPSSLLQSSNPIQLAACSSQSRICL